MDIITVDTEAGLHKLQLLLNRSDLGALDIEDTGAIKDHQLELVSLAITVDGETAYVVPGKLVEHIASFLEAVPWIMHNGAHDRRMMRGFGIDLELKHDTMAMAYLLNQTDPSAKTGRKGLEHLAQTILGEVAYKDVDYKNILTEPWDKIATMNGRDTIYTYRLFRPLADQINSKPALSRIYQWLLMPAVNALIKVTENGVPVDVPKLEELAESLTTQLAAVTEWLDNNTPPPDPEEYPKGWPKKRFNPGSFKQVGHVLYDVMGLECPKVIEETGNRSTDEDALTTIAITHPSEWIDKLLERRKTKKLLEYTEVWPSLWDENAVLHPKYKPLHVVTGRLSSELPNIQNVPRDPRFRGVFGGVPGYTWVKADYSQIELRIAAWVAGEDLMLEAYRNGEDLHTLTAKMILGSTKPEARQVAKNMNFGLLYGAGPFTLARQARMQYGFHLSIPEAREHRRAWFELYPSFLAWHRRMRESIVADRVAISPIGRVRQLPDARFANFKDEDLQKKAAKAIREGINHPVQSFASDLLLMSLVRVQNCVEAFGAKVVCEVHDELDFLVPDKDVSVFAWQIKNIMEDTSWLEKFGIKLTVPIVASLTSGSHWGNQKELT